MYVNIWFILSSQIQISLKLQTSVELISCTYSELMPEINARHLLLLMPFCVIKRKRAHVIVFFLFMERRTFISLYNMLAFFLSVCFSIRCSLKTYLSTWRSWNVSLNTSSLLFACLRRTSRGVDGVGISLLKNPVSRSQSRFSILFSSPHSPSPIPHSHFPFPHSFPH